MQLTKWVHEPLGIATVKVIHWPWSKVTQIQHFHFLFLKTARPIEAKFYVEPTVLGHMTKMSALPIHGKNLIKSSSLEPKGRWPWKLVCSIRYSSTIKFIYDEPGMSLTYFTARSYLVPYAFVWIKGKTVDFSETVVVYDIKVGRCGPLKEYMELYEHQRSRPYTDFGQNLSDSIFLNFFSSITTGPIGAKFHVEPPWDGRTKAFFGTKGPINLKLSMQHRVLEYYKICSNDAPGLTTTYFTARSNLVPYTIVWEKLKLWIFRNYCNLWCRSR